MDKVYIVTKYKQNEFDSGCILLGVYDNIEMAKARMKDVWKSTKERFLSDYNENDVEYDEDDCFAEIHSNTSFDNAQLNVIEHSINLEDWYQL